MTDSRRVQPSREVSVRSWPAPYKVMLPFSSLEEARLLIPLAAALAQQQHGKLFLLPIVLVPENQPRSDAAAQAIAFREQLNTLLREISAVIASIDTTVRSEDEVWDWIWEKVDQERADLLLLAWRTPEFPHTAVSRLAHPRLENPTCGVIALRPGPDFAAQGPFGQNWRLLLPVRGGVNSTLTLRVGYVIGQAINGSITLLHVTPPAAPEENQAFLDSIFSVVGDLAHITRSITRKGKVATSILNEANDHHVIIMGAPSRPPHPQDWSGPLLDEVLAGTDKTVIVVKERSPIEQVNVQSMDPTEVTVDRPVALVVDQWFADNTFHSREFSDLPRLLDLKEQQKLTISLGLPALNEEETVGTVIQTIKSALMDDIPLLDEIVLIDSGSEDRTREIAAELGIPVYIHQQILPELGCYRGKGEALWKSLYVLKGDIIAWVDTDIKNIHPRFVYGIIGPLLRNPHIQYVKGFYRRPLREGDKVLAGGGGRVTELTARPFFNLFYPLLSGLIQPLSGEYAGRRSALERMPFFTGYGVETGLLIDLLEEYGLEAIAQVDLLERIHHNQPLPSLSKMSFAIMQVVFSRLEKRHNVRLLSSANRTMNLIRHGQRRRYYLEPTEICEEERPPVITLPEYRQKFNRALPASLASYSRETHS